MSNERFRIHHETVMEGAAEALFALATHLAGKPTALHESAKSFGQSERSVTIDHGENAITHPIHNPYPPIRWPFCSKNEASSGITYIGLSDDFALRNNRRACDEVFPRQGKFAHDPAVLASNPPADVTVERIGDLLEYDLPGLLRPAAAAAPATKPAGR